MTATLSKRIPRDLSPNRLARLRSKLGTIPFDLTISNPTRCGIEYPPHLLAFLNDPGALHYHPDPRGPQSARDAIAGHYHGHGVPIDAEQVFVMASSSEAYSFIFKAIADPGDVIAVPKPSYPLFETLLRLEGMLQHQYWLETDDEWRIDFSSLESAPASTRAVVVVHPNNPTGSYIHPADADRLEALCASRHWTLIADEVFFEYSLSSTAPIPASFAGRRRCPVCTLGGFSKSLGLPQLKFSWLVVSGPERHTRPLCEGLEYVADAFLSVNVPVAYAAKQLMDEARPIHEAILERCHTNLGTLAAACAHSPETDVTAPQGGWSVPLRYPHVIDDVDLACSLLQNHGVAVHPGYFFDFSDGGWLVLSLLPPPNTFETGLQVVLNSIREAIG